MNERTASLLEHAQRDLETLYALSPGASVTQFLVPHDQGPILAGSQGRTLLGRDEETVLLGVALDPRIVERLERMDPRAGLNPENLDAFCVIAEEISHFVYLTFCATAERTITELELELQGEIDKFLLSASLLDPVRDKVVRDDLRERLFLRYRLGDEVTGERAERYQLASRLAWTYCGAIERRYLERRRPDELARESRRFYRLGQSEKLQHIFSGAAASPAP